jgi:hypothetical protein
VQSKVHRVAPAFFELDRDRVGFLDFGLMRVLDRSYLDREAAVGDSWRSRYDRLHLHTPRVQSHLPGYRLPRHYSRFEARDDLLVGEARFVGIAGAI